MVRKILIIKNDHIGDMILTTGVFREIKKAFPDSKIDVVVSGANKGMLESNPHVEKLIVIDHGKKFLKNWKSYPKIWKEIRKGHYDLAIDLRGDFINIFFLTFLTGIGKRYGFYKSYWSKLILSKGLERDINKHEVQNMFDVVNLALDSKLKNLKTEIFVKKSDEKELEDFLKKNKLTKFVCICPDASHPLRLLPLEEFDKIIKFINKNYPKYRVLIPGVSERVDWLVERNPKSTGMKKVNLKMLYLLFKRSGVVVSLDTGTTPLAWAGDSNLINVLLKFSVPYRAHLAPLSKNAVVVWEKDRPLEAKDIIDELPRFLKK